jgi:hypothetical protein
MLETNVRPSVEWLFRLYFKYDSSDFPFQEWLLELLSKSFSRFAWLALMQFFSLFVLVWTAIGLPEILVYVYIVAFFAQTVLFWDGYYTARVCIICTQKWCNEVKSKPMTNSLRETVPLHEQLLRRFAGVPLLACNFCWSGYCIGLINTDDQGLTALSQVAVSLLTYIVGSGVLGVLSARKAEEIIKERTERYDLGYV